MLQQGRLLRGMSQRELADRLGIGQKWVWQMESGKPGLFTERLFDMLRATGVHLYAEVDLPDDPPEARTADSQTEETGGAEAAPATDSPAPGAP